MAHKIYDNFYLSNEVEDQFNSHLDLQQFCTVDNSLVGTAGMKRKINVYKATAGTEKLKMGEGNTKSIEVSFTPEEYEIQLAQNKFQYYDEQEMTDPMLVPVGTRHMGTDMFNTVNGDVYGEFKKATMVVPTAKIDFAAFVDAVANLNIESTDNQPEKVAPQTFAFVHPGDTAELRKNLAEDLKYSTSGANSSVYAAAATSAEAQTNLIGSIAAQYLANIPDANGVNLLYAGGVGRVPRHNNGL